MRARVFGTVCIHAYMHLFCLCFCRPNSLETGSSQAQCLYVPGPARPATTSSSPVVLI